MKPAFCAFLLTAAAASVNAHGFLNATIIDGESYIGNYPYVNSTNPDADPPSAIRRVSDVIPVKGATNSSLGCGLDAEAAKLVAHADPGSTISFNCRGPDYVAWPHDIGPLLAYMTSCGSKSCDKFDTSNAKWFKIYQIGRKSNLEWAQADLMVGGVAAVTIPPTLAPGNYIIRFEIISLHFATVEGGAEFYPSCTQLQVGGSQKGGPSTDELVGFPGAYSDTDPGILDQSQFDPTAQYIFPGPPVAAFVQVAASSSSGSVQGVGNHCSTRVLLLHSLLIIIFLL